MLRIYFLRASLTLNAVPMKELSSRVSSKMDFQNKYGT
jgi:hypothetical protein